MRKITLNKTQIKIIDLEKKYMDFLKNLFKSDAFIQSMRKIENKIQKDYSQLQNFWQIKNKVAIALERITRFYIYKNPASKGVYHSPISSDIAFYTNDALICLDTKTIDIDGNAGDEKWIQFERNQVSIKNRKKHSKPPFAGVHYHESLPTIDKHTKKPILTFFLCLIYQDNSSTFSIKRMSLACVPNGELSSLYNFDLIKNYKTYHYITKQYAKQLQRQGHYNLEPKKEIQSNWINLDNGFYFDPNATHPRYPKENVARRYINKEYRVVLGGDSARIDPIQIKDRVDLKNQKWDGYIKWDL